MKTKLDVLVVATLLAIAVTGRSQSDITITNQPQNQTNCIGTTATFMVGATGTEPLFYQWQHAFDL